ncbi:MAG: M28 family peptidase [Oscillospiraceae bacterium]
MKASESNSRYTGKVRECTNYAVRGIKNLYKDPDLKTRQACSQGEEDIQKYFQGELENFSDSVVTETFDADISSSKITNIFVFVFMLLSAATMVAANFVSEVLLFASVGFSVLALASFFGLFKKLAKKKQSSNIIATRNALGVATHKVVFCANTDSPFKRGLSPSAEKLVNLIAFVGIIFQLAYDALILCDTYYNLFDNPVASAMPVISYILVVLVPFPLVASFAINTHSGTPGVANNLSGCFACLGAMRYLNEFDLKLDNTDVCVVFTGAKNAGNAGAKAYAKKHAENDKKIETTFICVDTLKGVSSLGVQGGTLKGAKLVRQAAENATIALTDGNSKFLKGDASIFAKAGITSATLTTLGSSAPDFYYTALDNVDNIDIKSTESAINILLESAYLIDEKK